MNLELIDARLLAADREWLTNVYPFYLHDLSEFDDSYYRLSERGLWEPDHLPSWLDPGPGQPLLIVHDGTRVGAALVNQAPSPYLAAGMDFRLSEFFILKTWRRGGLGQHAARVLFDRFRGRWQVDELHRNAPAIAFWRHVIGEYTGGRFEESVVDGSLRQTFDSSKM